MTVWIRAQLIGAMQKEANHSYPLETGGILTGYVADNNEPVILSVFGPGPNATHNRHRFEPDHEWQCQQLDELYAASQATQVYLGDWHTHPDSSADMSWRDRRTLRSIATHPNTMLASPLMLIGGWSGNQTNWKWECHRYDGTQMFGLIPKSISCQLCQF